MMEDKKKVELLVEELKEELKADIKGMIEKCTLEEEMERVKEIIYEKYEQFLSNSAMGKRNSFR